MFGAEAAAATTAAQPAAPSFWTQIGTALTGSLVSAVDVLGQAGVSQLSSDLNVAKPTAATATKGGGWFAPVAVAGAGLAAVVGIIMLKRRK